MVEPDHLVLEQLRAIRGEISKLVNEMQTMRVEMTAVRQHLAGMMTIQEHDHTEIAAMKVRLDRLVLVHRRVGITDLDCCYRDGRAKLQTL